MKIVTLSSGSSGNCIYLESDQSKILIDVGLTGKLALHLLSVAGIQGHDIDAIFVTHEHSDHIKGVGVLSRKFDIPILANEKTWLAMQAKIGKIAPKNIIVFKSNTFFSFRDLDVHNVSTFHDAADPVFFNFYQRDQKISILTDTGIYSNTIIDAVKGSKVLVLESNHDISMLENGPYPYDLKMRIKGNYGHMSNDSAGQVMDKIVRGNGEKVILGHLSKTNNRPKLAYDSLHKLLVEKGLSPGKDIKIDVAKEFEVGEVTDLGGNYSWT